MKSLGYLAAIVIGYYVFFGGNNKRENYDKGYETAWEQESAPSRWANKEEKRGYEAGLDDAWTYNTGYDDGYEGRKPLYFNDSLYMDAYKDGKEDK